MTEGTAGWRNRWMRHESWRMTDTRPPGDPHSYEVIGAAMAVHRELGRGFLEAPYREALGLELTWRGVPFAKEVILPISYRGVRLRNTYRVDFVVRDALIVEVKALGSIGNGEVAQVLNYLKASGYTRSLILNFGTASLQQRRLVMTRAGGCESAMLDD